MREVHCPVLFEGTPSFGSVRTQVGLGLTGRLEIGDTYDTHDVLCRGIIVSFPLSDAAAVAELLEKMAAEARALVAAPVEVAA